MSAAVEVQRQLDELQAGVEKAKEAMRRKERLFAEDAKLPPNVLPCEAQVNLEVDWEQDGEEELRSFIPRR